ncbi:hypothetical protein [Geodermatophilus sp. TF02-6]|uniref:hypothetical protein n=1 Tax=Geodermatophilus sp. TF02-6 TaxID=2250575 RepID=UPI0011BEF768|nr:hypothetical protein [Geodermatophilus sp. TF02-6]
MRRRRRAGRRLDRAAAADALAEALAGRRGRLLGGEQVLESLDDRPSPSPAAPVRWRLDTDAAVADVLRRVRRHRRRRVATAAAALAAAALAVPLVQPHGEPAPPAPQRTAPADVPVLTEPTRGSLAADRGFVEAVRRVDWGPMVAPPVADRRVVLATDTPSGRVVLLAGTVDEDVRGTWLTGPVGAAPDDLAPHLPRHLGPLRPAALVLGGPGPATLVVVAGRDDAVEVSPRLQVGPRGTVGRTYRPAPADDGVAVVPLQTTAGGTGASVRVLRDGQPVYRSGVGGPQLPAAAPDPPDLDPPDLDPLRPSAVRPAPRAVAEALTAVAVPLGAEPAALEPQLLWSGALPPAGVPGTVAVLVGRSPGGGLLVVTEAAQVGPGGAGRTVPCGVSTPPGTTDVAGLVVARVCDLSTPTEDGGRWLVVTAPPGAAGAAVLDRRGSVLATLRFDGGGAVGRLPEGARTVRTLDGDGRALAEVPVAAAPTAPFGDYGGGPVG